MIVVADYAKEAQLVQERIAASEAGKASGKGKRKASESGPFDNKKVQFWNTELSGTIAYSNFWNVPECSSAFHRCLNFVINIAAISTWVLGVQYLITPSPGKERWREGLRTPPAVIWTRNRREYHRE